jgi:hypothetical protein
MHGPLMAHNNLSDVMDAATARSHLGAAASSDIPSVPTFPLSLANGGTGVNVASDAALLSSLGAAALAGATFTGYTAPAVNALTFGTAIAVDASTGNEFSLTLTASNGTITTPANPVDGQVVHFRVIQGGTGSYTLSYGTAFDFGTTGTPTLSTAVAKLDILKFDYVASLSKWCYLGANLGF